MVDDEADILEWQLIQYFLLLLISFSKFRRAAKVEMDGHFLYSVVYKDEVTFNLVGAAVNILGTKIQNVELKMYHTKLHLTLKMSGDRRVEERKKDSSSFQFHNTKLDFSSRQVSLYKTNNMST